ncbi:PQQ-dependent sugar dehydrogenase [Pseudoduganella namucuonensis]|uniref:Glucose/arabinose dehydrogenase, beta-propeller fold n=1 Tax=Pseudoduganella namucuonensis TaxID=1035707 RepID=A0A1I7IIG6_9BURK|nr:PQQ-dependent sugar dehydrogenase [Pseudoduganella namucuonensis]SFU72724.1 Glucose/arabinose dehydrogenase, beta-propeller fold [Pseudoduganella namucuonensis]
MHWLKFAVQPVSILLLASCGGGGGGATPVPPTTTLALTLRQVVGGLNQPIYLTAPAGDARLFIAERPGRIRIVSNGALLTQPFVDISAKTTVNGERGLLSMAFHPQYAQNGYFYLYYTDTNGDIAVDRMQVSGDANVANPASATRVISVPHPGATNHNGGQLAFGPDGYLYLGTGDGGGAGDPNGNAQNPTSLLGKMLRLDVGGSGPGYAIPPDNPYIGMSSRRNEIWASGLRNPWRFAFDRTDGLLYIADVGQGEREEVNIAAATQGGNNYGWRTMEGTACYNAATCERAGLFIPQFEYQHGANDANGCSITGGFVYRGAAIPELAGEYFYSDYCKGYLKSFPYRNGVAGAVRDWATGDIGNVLSFGQDAAGELYMLSANGGVYRIAKR